MGTEAAVDHPPHKASPTIRVLCVDDNRDIADSTAMLLTYFDFDARVCYDGPTALRLAESFHPAVCILDLNMPGMDGDELAVLLRDQAPAVLLVATTAMTNDDARGRIGEAGFNVFLAKPVNPTKLIEVVEALFRLGPDAERLPLSDEAHPNQIAGQTHP